MLDPDAFTYTILLVVTLRKHYLRTLRKNFKVDVRRQRPLPGAVISPPDLLPRFHKEVTYYRFYETAFRACLVAMAMKTQSLSACLVAGAEAAVQASALIEIMAEGVRAMQQVFHNLPLFVATTMASPDPSSRERALIEMVGWARTQLSLKKNTRLREKLRKEAAAYNKRIEDVFVELLLSNTFAAW